MAQGPRGMVVVGALIEHQRGWRAPALSGRLGFMACTHLFASAAGTIR